MDKTDILKLLTQVQNGDVSPVDAVSKLKLQPFEDLGYAKIDYHRAIRQGIPEVIYGEGKAPEHLIGIIESMLSNESKNILITRLDKEPAEFIQESVEMDYHKICRVGIVGSMPKDTGKGHIVIATGGTSDIPVAEEAALTAEVLGNKVIRLYDVGVSGLHRLLSNMEPLITARVIVAVAGMEGALASVIGGLVDCPVVAVPTSIGYGANFGGIAALLSMLNSCASGVSVVNIDNGFGAGYLASMINHQ